MRTGAERLKDSSDRPLIEELPREDGTFCMDPLAVIHHVFPLGAACSLPGFIQLSKGGKGGFVGEIILPAIHYPASERTALARNCGRRNEFDRGVIENLFQALRALSLGELRAKSSDF